MATVNKFEDLEIWQKARTICIKVNLLTQKDKFRKDFSLVDQIKRSSGSVMDNIAEGFERDGTREFIQFLNIAKGSIGETRSQLYRASDSSYISQDEFDETYTDCIVLSKQIRSFSNYLVKCEYRGHKFQ
ncbi:MAG: four helix bundle protein [Prolixibacteraceae bacterium]|jgi:four helix bundle protein|nr:four helix bundle protein [Prolixibacteraceae bacterium]